MFYVVLRTVTFLFFMALAQNAFSISTPSVGANTLFLLQNSNFHKENVNPSSLDETPNGINIQETELQFSSDVDPYTKLILTLSIAPSYSSDGTTVSEEWGIEPEEAYAESTSVPSATLKVGKFKAAMGKHNTLHTHAYPLIRAPIANTKLLGGEGLNDIGVSAEVLVPAPWFNEISLQVLRGKGENEEFNSPSPGKSLGLVHWKNLVDLSDDLTLEVGASYARGDNSYLQITSLSGADLTFKWRPSSGGRYQSLLWATEFLSRTQEQRGVADERGSGVASWIQYQFAERWSAVYRFDNLTVSDTFDAANLPNNTWEGHSIALAFSPSEFSSYKLEYNQRTGDTHPVSNESIEHAVFLQANFTIGAHPSHKY